MEKFKIRASAIGQIMASPRAKKDAGNLSQTAKTYVHNWILQKKYNRKKEISSVHIKKGNSVEHDSIELYMEFCGGVYLKKNEQHFTNDYIEGTPDIITPELIDIKSSWDLFTFPYFDEKLENSSYEFQMQGYMDLINVAKSKIVYVLADTPSELINAEVRKQQSTKGIAITPELFDEIKYNLTFSDIKIEDRIREFEVIKRDISEVYERVEQIREYIKKIL